MGWSPDHKRIKECYNPVPNAAEARHKKYVLEQPCFGCGNRADHAHHTLLKFPSKRWRRDHRCLLPTCEPCHTSIHDYYGTEEAWLDSKDREPYEAVIEIERLWAESELIAQYEGRKYG